MAKRKPSTIKEYIEAAQPEARPHLRQIYRILKSIAPDRTEAVKWGVPVFWDKGMLFGFAAYQKHLSFGPGEASVAHYSKELANYKFGKGTIQFPYDQPLPEELIREIAAFCVASAREE